MTNLQSELPQADAAKSALIFDVSAEALVALQRFAEHHGLSLDAAIEALGYHLPELAGDLRSTVQT